MLAAITLASSVTANRCGAKPSILSARSMKSAALTELERKAPVSKTLVADLGDAVSSLRDADIQFGLHTYRVAIRSPRSYASFAAAS